MSRSDDGSAFLRSLLLASLSLWACTYLAQTSRLAIEAGGATDLVRVKRAISTLAGAGIYFLLLMMVARWRGVSQGRQITLLAAGTVGAGLLVWVLRIAVAAAQAGAVAPLDDVRWVLFWYLFFGTWLAGGLVFLRSLDSPAAKAFLRRIQSFAPREAFTGAARDRSSDWNRDLLSLHRARSRRPSLMIIMSGLGAGGAERVASTLANHWVGRGYKVSVLSFEKASAPSYYTYSKDVVIHRLGLPPARMPKHLAVAAFVRRIGTIRKVSREIAPDVIVSFLTRPNVLTLIATHGLGIPVIISERSNPALQYPGPLWSWLRRSLYPRAFSLVTMTEGAANFFSQDIRKITRVIPNPVTLPPEWRDLRGTNMLVAVGRLEPVKGFDLLIRSFADVASQHPDWKLKIWGDGNERALLEAMRDKLELRGRVHLPGLTSKAGTWIETADAFVLSSYYEGWPNALIEAMASGLPVVSTNCAWGPADMIRNGDDGILVPPGDPASLSTALSRLMGDPVLRSRLGKAARRSASRFSPDTVFAQWDRLLAAAMASAEKAFSNARW
jgi:glycosyltransferase involved in cell wall biosynthesis